MKKIVSLVLLFACVISFSACANVDAFIEIIDASEPTRIVTKTHTTIGNEKLEGEFTTLVEGDMVTFNYWYDRYAIPGVDDSENRIFRPDPSVVYYTDGKYSTDAETWFTEAPELGLGNIGLNLDRDYLGDFSVSNDKRTLYATLNAEQAAVVLGIDGFVVDENGVELIVKTNGTKLVNVSVSYSTGTSVVSIETSYEYVAPEAPETEEPETQE